MTFNRSFNQHPPRVQTSGQQTGWLRLVFLLMLIAYWVFAWYMERINLSNVPLPNLIGAVIPFPLPSSLTFLRELFHWRVLRHFLPVIVGAWLAYEAAASLVKALYDLPDKPGAKRLLSRLIRAQAPAGTPLPIQNATLEDVRGRHVLLRVGGPGIVRINRGDVAVTELNGRFHRILPAGMYNLHRFEYIHAVLNLQPQERFATNIPLVTRDGIQFSVDIHVLFQIKPGPEPVTATREFPMDEDAIHAAAYAQTVVAENKVQTWESIPLGKARGILTGIIAGYPLDEILAHSSSAAEPLQVIQAELLRKTRAALRPLGIQLISLHVGRLVLPEAVTEQYIKYWQSQSDAYIRLSVADGEATALEEIEIARAEAEVTMIQAILEGVQRAKYGNNTASMREIVALRMIEALEKMARQSQSLQGVPPQLLTQLSNIRHQLGTGQLSSDPAEQDNT
ncbi:MAG: hypothetical protein DWQ04_20935 [Chloroflexi bacterium]|nr:MAG: hypothetical protein DWQ04_20935 [Chloroflexota bacterium]